MSMEPTNKDRAEWAAMELCTFQYATGTDWCDVVADLLCDLMHFCDRESFDFDRELDRARMHYEAEQPDEAKDKTVIIEVSGGVAHVSECPRGVTVKIID